MLVRVVVSQNDPNSRGVLMKSDGFDKIDRYELKVLMKSEGFDQGSERIF